MAYNPYAEITARILETMQSGAPAWQKEWKSEGFADQSFPYNVISRKNYSGGNVLLLWMTAKAMGYTHNAWLTFAQANNCGGSVRKGEHGTKIFFMTFIDPKDKKKEDDDRKIPILKSYTVFNFAQCEGLNDDLLIFKPRKSRNEDERDQEFDEFVRLTDIDVREGFGSPYYSPGKDFISIPAFASFSSFSAFANTMSHEIGHALGAEHRCNRRIKNAYGSKEYAAEELVAELFAAFCAASWGFDNISRNAAYMNSWIKLLEDHPHALWAASSQAQKAFDYVKEYVLHNEGVKKAA